MREGSALFNLMQATVRSLLCAKDTTVMLSRATDCQCRAAPSIAVGVIALGIFALAPRSNAAPVTEGDAVSMSSLKILSIEDLMNLEITSVSKTGEPLSDAAAAVYVITREEILHSGARSLPDILR